MRRLLPLALLLLARVQQHSSLSRDPRAPISLTLRMATQGILVQSLFVPIVERGAVFGRRAELGVQTMLLAEQAEPVQGLTTATIR